MLSFFNPEPIEIHRKALTGSDDAYGNRVYEDIIIQAEGLVGFRANDEKYGPTGSTSLEEYKIIFNGYQDIQDGDVFIVRGLTFIQDGEPIAVTPAFGSSGFLPVVNAINVKRAVRNG